MSFSTLAAVDQSEIDYLCNSINLYDPWIASPTDTSISIINTSEPAYVEVGGTIEIKAEQDHYIVIENLIPKLRTAREFSFFGANGAYSIPTQQRGFSHDEDYHMTFSSRGVKRAVVMALDDTASKIPGQGPFGEDVWLPLCDAIEVFAHNKPCRVK